jgi:DNA-binding GntR family transcriptional regulator
MSSCKLAESRVKADMGKTTTTAAADKRVFSSKKEMIFTSLREEIVRGDLKPGERLIIDDIAARHKVSHIPVREALQALAVDGFVTMRPHVGATVSDVDSNLVMEVFELLEALELVSSRAACRLVKDSDIDELTNILKEMDGLLERPEIWSAQNYEFHEKICDIAGFTLASKLLESVRVHWDRIRRQFFSQVFLSNLPEAQKEHWEILNALKAQDADELSDLLRLHNRHARKSYQRAMEDGKKPKAEPKAKAKGNQRKAKK